jgi:heme exporter protein C
MLTGMLLMSLAIWLYAIAIALWRVRSLILLRESHAVWVQQLPEVLAHRAHRAYRVQRGAT